MVSPTVSAPYAQAVINAMQKLYPESLADKSFDNTGLLLEAPFNPTKQLRNSALLTIDLTKAVADEAIERRLKSLTLQDTQQQSLLRLAAEGISVYSPHTAVDCAAGGNADWLADIITGTPRGKSQPNTIDSNSVKSNETGQVLHHQPSFVPSEQQTLDLGNESHERYPIRAVKIDGHKNAGMGRIVRFEKPVRLTSLLTRIRLGLGDPKAIPVAIPQSQTLDAIRISSVGICAGSGGSIFGEIAKHDEDVDLLFTGEISHHEALAAIEKGKCVITLGHSNSERGFLNGVLKKQLEDTIREEWDDLRKNDDAGKQKHSTEYLEALKNDDVEVHVSERDRDPFGMVLS